jgi:hypothetical protein
VRAGLSGLKSSFVPITDAELVVDDSDRRRCLADAGVADDPRPARRSALDRHADEERPYVPMPARIGGSGIDGPRLMGRRRW